MRLWKETEVKTLTALYPDVRCAVIAKVLNRGVHQVYSKASRLGLHKSEGFFLSKLSGRLNEVSYQGVTTRFEEGHVPTNKGLKWADFMSPKGQENSRRTTFQKGQPTHNTKENGTISIRKDSQGNRYKWIKMDGKYKMLHVYNWEQENGKVSKNHILVFKTTDKMNCELGNLELITKKENMLRNSIQRFPKELQVTMKKLSQLKKTINGKE